MHQTWNSDLTNNGSGPWSQMGRTAYGWIQPGVPWTTSTEQDFTHFDSTGMQLLGQRIRTIRMQGADSVGSATGTNKEPRFG